MYKQASRLHQALLTEIAASGLSKSERILTTPQGTRIRTTEHPGSSDLLNFCANNYLGLATHSRLVATARLALETYGFGLSSVRFICGTQTVHKDLEHAICGFFETEDTILYSSCFDANGGLFEALLGDEDAVISDALNHASIIDGIRLCKAERHRYPHGDMDALEAALQKASSKRIRLIATDGVFSMDGYFAKLGDICDLADRYDAMVMVDDSHATGFIGPRGRGTPEHCSVMSRVDLITSTFGKALGGASGGFTTGRREAIALLRQRSRPYLFSNTLAPVIAATTIDALSLIDDDATLRTRLMDNAADFRNKITLAGFTIRLGVHPIVPVVIGDANLAQRLAHDLLDEGIYVIAFSYPVVPKDEARIRVQLSALHTKEDIDAAVTAFQRVGDRLGIV